MSTLGGVDAWARRLGLSLAGTFAFYNVSVVLTALASLFWVWSPIVGAASANTGLRIRFKYAGTQETVRSAHRTNCSQEPGWTLGCW